MAQPPTMNDYMSEHAGLNVLDTAGGPKQQYQRTYQACLPCRKRKVKCDLGSPENPHDPPCARCRREQKPCAFSLTRRKRKSSTLESESDDDDAPIHLQRKRSARGALPARDSYEGSVPPQDNVAGESAIATSAQAALFPLNGNGQDGHRGQTEGVQDEEVHNPTAVDIFGPQHVTGPTNAMQTLIHAAGLLKNDMGQHAHGGAKANLRADGSQVAGQRMERSQDTGSFRARAGSHRPASPLLDPAFKTVSEGAPEISEQSLQVWSRLRFVRAGWFTAKEACQYIEYYYQHLAPLTPVTHPDFRQIENNPNLLSQEPMLTVTLLTIASRYMRVRGRGSETRSLMIHDRLWQYLQDTVTRMFWGQEQCGGGFCGAGARRTASDGTNSWDTSRLRSLGSIESLLLLSDFHPRSIHFPPGNDDGELVTSTDDVADQEDPTANEASRTEVNDSLEMFEPIARSGKMSWSLICFAHTLAYELGVFGTYATGKSEHGGRIKSNGSTSFHEQRMDRIDQLLFIYLTQASGRFGLPGLYPKHLADRYMLELSGGFQDDPTSLGLEPADLNLHYCIELTTLNKLCNDRLFQSQQATEKLIESGEVVGILSDLVPRLEAWKRRLNIAPVDEDTKTLLSIEVNYFLCFVNGQGLQAWWNHFRSTYSHRHNNGDHQSPASSVSSHLSSLTDQHERYIIGCVNASREILQHVVVNLGKNSKLRHAPVRTISSVTSAAMFLCKTFMRGNLRSSVNQSIRLIDETIRALRASKVDDVHLSLQWADILELINKRVSSKFITLAAPAESSPSQTSLPLSQSGSPPVRGATQSRHPKPKPRASSFTTRPHPRNPDLKVVMPPPSRNMYHHHQQQQQQQAAASSSQPALAYHGETSSTGIPSGTPYQISEVYQHGINTHPPLYPPNAIDDIQFPNPTDAPPATTTDAPTESANNNMNNISPVQSSAQPFNLNPNDEPWMGLPLAHAVNARSSSNYAAGPNPMDFEFANPFRMESITSLEELLNISLGQGQGMEFGNGEGFAQ